MKLSQLFEGPQEDAMVRRRAERAYSDLLRAVARIGGISGMIEYKGAYIAKKEVLRHPEDIGFVVWQATRTSPAGAANVTKRMLVLYLNVNSDLVEQMKLSQVRSVIIHEFIHMFDSERIRTDAIRSSNNSSLPDYYNNPMETNAYAQEALAKFEYTLSRLSPRARELQFSKWSNSFNRWYDMMLAMIDKDFSSNLNLKNDRNLKRRLYKYWDSEIKGKA